MNVRTSERMSISIVVVSAKNRFGDGANQPLPRRGDQPQKRTASLRSSHACDHSAGSNGAPRVGPGGRDGEGRASAAPPAPPVAPPAPPVAPPSESSFHSAGPSDICDRSDAWRASSAGTSARDPASASATAPDGEAGGAPSFASALGSAPGSALGTGLSHAATLTRLHCRRVE